ncbi:MULTISPECIES: hypothetical protein [unclassified Lysinibacillus]|uniref:hypothetical protein n=1 Tax=unclassified Lysinibacillus TaxID=2636778 RepID=UPI00232D049C|nr:hypothetical protein [Lysinibacillus sp. OF-1]WCH45809.1 hypothetical protein NV349_11890 [Lysinibacillus sp. OF-1]
MLVHNKGNYTRIANDVKVIPGANTLLEAEYTAFVAHPIIKGLIKSGEIVVPEGQNAASLKDLDADEAIKLVKDTFSIEFLEKFKEDEKRKTVLSAIDAQIAEIQGN